MNDRSDARRFAARMSALPEILECVRQACRDSGIVPPVALGAGLGGGENFTNNARPPSRDSGIVSPAAVRAELVIEELFTNTVRHGYRGECDDPVWLHALPSPGTLCLTYQDAARAFDPLALELVEAAVAPHHVGGQGIRLIRSLANSVAYGRADERNILTLLFAVAPASCETAT